MVFPFGTLVDMYLKIPLSSKKRWISLKLVLAFVYDIDNTQRDLQGVFPQSKCVVIAFQSAIDNRLGAGAPGKSPHRCGAHS
jgi:hypothetical protein